MEYFFDLDGTLLDHPRARTHAVRTLAKVSFNMSDEALVGIPRLWFEAENLHFARYERGEISYAEQRRERLRQVFSRFCAGFQDLELDKLYAVYLEAYQSEWHLFPDARPILEALEGRPAALITNGESALQRSKIARLGIERYFTSIVVSGELGEHKPSARPFHEACRQVGVSPHEVCYVGDSFSNDVIGSINAGMRAIWINRDRMSPMDPEVEFVEIRSLSELSI